MKLMLKRISFVLMALLFVLSLTGCGMSGDLKTTYESAGYRVVENSTDESTRKVWQLEMVEGEGEDAVTHIVAAIVEFESLEDMKNALGEEAYAKAEKDCNIRENSLFIANSNEETLAAKAKIIFEKYVVFSPMSFVDNLAYIGWGMLGIFVVIGLIVITTVILNRATAGKKNTESK